LAKWPNHFISDRQTDNRLTDSLKRPNGLTRERNTYNGKKKVKEKDRKSLKESERKII